MRLMVSSSVSTCPPEKVLFGMEEYANVVDLTFLFEMRVQNIY